MNYTLYPLGDQAIIIELGNKIHPSVQQKVQAVSVFIEERLQDWIRECVPSFTSVAVYYDPYKIKKLEMAASPYQFICEKIANLLQFIELDNIKKSRVVEVPVCYDQEFGPDLLYVAEYNNLTMEEVIHIHSSGEYLVHMIGFAPGFPYIGGMSTKIATSRRESPRLKIPAGSVGIAGIQTGIYPIETPGGWQIIGRTPLPLFLPNQNPPTLLRAGDTIKFVPISNEEYLKLEGPYL